MKLVGCCTTCGCECFDISERFPDGHVLAGEPRRVGRMLDCGTQIEFMLSDGSLHPLTFCLDCSATILPDDYPAIWDTVVSAWERSITNDHREAIGAKPWTDEQREKYRRRFYPLWIVGRLWNRTVDDEHKNVKMDRRPNVRNNVVA